MTAKSGMTALVIALLLLGAGTVLFVQHRSQVSLDRENQLLRQRVEELSQLAAENERLSNLVAVSTPSSTLSNRLFHELLSLRGEVGRLRLETRDAEKLREENERLRTETAEGQARARTAGPATQGDVPKESWAFAGYATPEAAVQSAVWAASRGDVRTFYASLTDEGRQELEREQKDQPEADFAAKGIEVFSRFIAFRVIDEHARSDGAVVLTVSMIHPDGTAQTEKMILKRVGTEWKIASD